MLSLVLWLAGTFLGALILLRGIRGQLLARYPFFLAYVASVLGGSCLLYVIHVVRPEAYAQWFWRTQFLTLALGCGILLEIFHHVLSPYPGAEKFARTTALVVFGAVFCFAAIYPHIIAKETVPATAFEFERDLRTVQAIFLFAILAVIFYYGIAVGKNMKGMIYGYALYIATSLAALAIHSYAGPVLRNIWDVIPPLSFIVSNYIWLVSMWSYHPNPAPRIDIHLEEDYEAFAARTRGLVGIMRSHLTKGARA